MIWGAFLLSSLALSALAGKDRAARVAALAFAAGVCAMAVWPVSLPAHMLWLASCGTWVAVAASCSRSLPLASFALLLSALCYPYARMIGAEFGQSHAPAIAADLLGALALGVIGWRGRGGFVGISGAVRMGADRRRSC